MTRSPLSSIQFPRNDLPPGWRIEPVGTDRRRAAVERLVAQGTAGDGELADRFLAFAQSNAVPLDGLWAVLDGKGRICASCLTVPSPGRTAMVFASHPRDKAETCWVSASIQAASQGLGARRVALAQTILEPHDRLDRDAFERAGFTHLAELSYLQRAVPAASRAPRAIEWPEGASTVAYHEGLRDELLAILDASYEDTLDCPGLLGLRDTADILAGHTACGRFEPALWTLLRFEGRPAGALLLNPSPAHETIELAYLGLAKFARGRGLGRCLLHYGLQLLAGRAERTINLAVDNANAPALALYRRAGFSAAFRRTALILPLPMRAAGAMNES